MGCPDFHWENIPVLELWREKHDSNGKHDSDGKPHVILESYHPEDSIEIIKESLANNKVSYLLYFVQQLKSNYFCIFYEFKYIIF